MKPPSSRPSAKLAYEAPRIRKVKLAADELAVAGCKSQMVGTEVCLRGGVLVNRFRGIVGALSEAAPLPEITLPELFAEWDVAGRRLPVEGVLETTFRCNLRCVHCYVNKPAGAAEERARELPTARLKSAHRRDRGCGLPQPAA